MSEGHTSGEKHPCDGWDQSDLFMGVSEAGWAQKAPSVEEHHGRELFSPGPPSPLPSPPLSSPLLLSPPLNSPPLLPLPFLSPLLLSPSASLFHFSFSLSLSHSGCRIPLCPLALAALLGSVGFVLELMASTSAGFQAGRRQGWAEVEGEMASAVGPLVRPTGVGSVPARPWTEHEWHLESHRPGLLSPTPR